MAEILKEKGKPIGKCQDKDAVDCPEECLTIRKPSVTTSASLGDVALLVAAILHSIGILYEKIGVIDEKMMNCMEALHIRRGKIGPDSLLGK